LTLDHCQFDNQVLASATLPSQLEFLSLSDSNLDDNGLKAVGGCANLTHLQISNSKVTDASADLILSLPKLETASTYGSSMSWAARDKLDAALQANAVKAAGGNTPQTSPR
jgi:hypothetical protein